jgi:glycosyltransferase involved in cell wall biosynthesis
MDVNVNVSNDSLVATEKIGHSVRNLRIVFDMTFPNRLQTGTRVYANELLAALQMNSSHRFTCLAEPVPARSRSVWRKAWNGIRNVFWIQVVLPIRLLGLKADVLHAPSFFAPLLCPCPVVLTIYDTLYLTQAQHYGDKLFLLYAKLFIKPAVRRCALISTISRASRTDILSAFGVPEKKIYVIYPGVNSRFRPTLDAAAIVRVREKYGIASPFFLFVGALEPRKNLSCLLRAFSFFLKARQGERQFRLVLAGPGGPAFAELQQIAQKLDISEHVQFLGYIPDDDIPSLYSAAHAFVFPSLGEGFGLPIVEAMACGTPVVTSNVSSIPEVAGDAAVLVDPEDVQALARAMERVAFDDDLRRHLIKKGVERAALFTWPRAAQETEQLYEMVCNGGSGDLSS